MPETRNALISVFDKTGIDVFARFLVEMDWTIYSSGGTYKHLHDNGVEAIDVATIVGKPMLGHKVVTLSREVHAGLLVYPELDLEMEEFEALGLPFFDLACIDLYPLMAEIMDPDATPATIRDKTDIGGPTMLRSAAKGRRLVISQPEQRDSVQHWLQNGEPNPDRFRLQLAMHAELTVAAYCLASAEHLRHLVMQPA